MNQRKSTLPWISGLSLIGAIVSIWQTNLFFKTRSGMGGMHSFCNIGETFDCTAIEMSRFAELIPGIPLSAFAIAGYLMILVLSLYGFSETLRTNVRKYLVAFTAIAFLFSLIYLGIMVGVIGKLCLLCLGVDLINFILLILALKLPKVESKSGGIQMPRLLGTGAAALVIAFFISLANNPQSQVKQEDLDDMVYSVLNARSTAFTLPADVPFVGNPNAPITIVKFSDYECPACRMGANAIHPLFKRYPNQVKFAFMNYPLAVECNTSTELKRTIHEFACESAAAAVCAQDQGKFIETYETLFENQDQLSKTKIPELLKGISGLDVEKLKSCMTQPSTLEKIKRDTQLGNELKVQSTPTFFINGKRVEGGLPTNLWITIIDQMLK